MANGADATVKRGVYGVGYGDDFDQFHGFGQNQVAALPVPLVSSSPLIYAKPFLVSKISTSTGDRYFTRSLAHCYNLRLHDQESVRNLRNISR